MGKVIGWPNFLNTVVSYLKNEDTVQRTRTVADRDGRLLDDTDLIATKVSITGGIVLDNTAFDKLHICSGTSADYTVGLPSAINNEGKTICIKGDPNPAVLNKAVTIDGNGTETIDNYTSIAISTGGYIILMARVESGVGSWVILAFEQGARILWTPTVTGFSSVPSTSGTSYRLAGKYLDILLTVTPTASNATTFTITLPNGLLGLTARGFVGQIYNNGSVASTTGGFLGNGTNVLSLFPSVNESAWTSGGPTKGMFGVSFRVPIV